MNGRRNLPSASHIGEGNLDSTDIQRSATGGDPGVSENRPPDTGTALPGHASQANGKGVMKHVSRFFHRVLLGGLLAVPVGLYLLLAWLLIQVMGLFGVRISWAAATIMTLLLVTACLVPLLLTMMRHEPCMKEVHDGRE